MKCEEAERFEALMAIWHQEYEKLSVVYQKYIARLEKILPVGCTLIPQMLKKLPWGSHLFCDFAAGYFNILYKGMGSKNFHSGLDG